MGFDLSPAAYIAALTVPLLFAGAIGWSLVKRRSTLRAVAIAIVAAVASTEYLLLVLPQFDSPESSLHRRATTLVLVGGVVIVVAILLAARRRSRSVV